MTDQASRCWPDIFCLGDIALAQGQLDAAEAHYEESLAGYQAVEDPGTAALALAHLANVYRAQGDYDKARSAVGQSLRVQERTGLNERIAAYAHLYLGDVEGEQGQADRASASYRTCLDLASKIEYVVGVVECLEHTGWLGEPVRPQAAVTILAAAQALRGRIGMALAPIDGPAHREALEELRGRLGNPSFEEAWVKGESMDSAEAAPFALSELARCGRGW